MTGDDTDRRVILTDKKTIAESCFYLKGKPFSLKDYPPMHAIYEISSRKTVICSGRQVSKTLVGSSMVSMHNGRPERLDALRRGSSVLSMTGDFRIVEGAVLDFVVSGRKPCLRVTTRLGNVLEIARTHPVRMLAGYRPGGDLVVGDRVAAVRMGGEFTGKSALSHTEAMVLAYMIGDGSAQGRQNFGFTNSNPELLGEFESCCAILGQVKPRPYARKGSITLRLSLATDAPVRRLLETHGLYGTLSGSKFVPDEVFDLDREKTALFLNRLWACDGHVNQVNPGKYEIHYATISERLARGVQALLWKFGIPTSVSWSKPKVYEGTDKWAYKVRVETQEGVRRFLLDVGAFCKSESVSLPEVEANNNRDTIPQEVQTLITALYERGLERKILCGRGKSGRTGARISDHGLRSILKYPPTSRKLMAYVDFFRAVGLGEEPEVATLAALSCSDILWDEIVAIEDIGLQDCYDIEVPTYHNYVVNGVVTHNSTTAANFLTAECIGEPHWEAIAVLPSVMQMRRFSNQRVGKVIADSPQIRKWYMNTTCKRNTMERSMANGSVMYFGALTQAESLRGLSGNRIMEDEVQDMVGDELAIVEESLSGQASDKQFIMRTGTAKTVGNLLETTMRDSTGCEWIIICPSGHHNLPSVENIGDHYFICKKCKSRCDVRNGYWRAMNGLDKEWVGFRIPQIILPLHAEDTEKWETIAWKRHNLDPRIFLNEVMGQAAGSGLTILDEDDLKACCEPNYSNYGQLYIPRTERYLMRFATVDWGLTARKSFTVVSIWGLTPDMRLKLLFVHRYINPDIFKQVDDIAQVIQGFGVQAVGVDWGAGVAQSRILEEKIRMPVQRFMYVGEQMKLMKWDADSQLWKVNRTQAMTETFIKMKRKEYWFPEWSFFKDYGKDILCIYEEPLDDRNNNEKIKYDHSDDSPDDFTHTCVYAQLLLHLATDRGRAYM